MDVMARMSLPQSPDVWIAFDARPEGRRAVTLGSQIVGRSASADVPLASEWVSHHHAEIYWDGHRLRIRDLGSRNGTSVNGTRTVDWVDLHDGDVVAFADVRGSVHLGDASAHGERPTASHPATVESHAPRSDGLERRLSSVPVFVSHSSEDKHAARAVAGYLRRAGWAVWIDEAGISGGKDWRGELVRALERTWVVVLLVSLTSMRSKWVVREVQAADRLGKTIIPVVIDDAPYPDALRLVLGGVQKVDLTQWNDHDRAARQFSQLDEALVLTARQGTRTPPGKTQIAIGKVLGTIGLAGFIGGMALFAGLGLLAGMEGPSGGEDLPRAFIGFGVCFVSMIIALVGEGLRRAGMRKGI
jgi:hypothetical protein